MKIDVSKEIVFATARSSGKGGQNVNKVETMVEGRWEVSSSSLFSIEQKELLLSKLSKKITAEGFLLVKSQTARTQLANKSEVIKKLNALVLRGLEKPKLRKATRPSKASIEKRLEQKKNASDKKSVRKRIRNDEL